MALPNPRRTKIVATIGPASDSPEAIESLLRAGVDVFRLGLAHESVDRVLERLALIRKLSEQTGISAAVLADLPGPKVRAGSFGDGVELVTGSTVTLRAGVDPSTKVLIHVSYDRLAETVEPGDNLTLGDGKVVIEVSDSGLDELTGRVVFGGAVKGRPGVHIPADRLDVSSPTADDLAAVDPLVEAGIDMVAVSFVRTARDIRALGLERAPVGPLVIAKIETQAAVDNLDTILDVSDGVMVACGDLGLECSLPQLPGLQKRIIESAVRAGRPVITATQMLESMTEGPLPTRAEVNDVANAVHDGTSAVMLSGETAIGIDPTRVIEMMNEILLDAERSFDTRAWARRVESLGELRPMDTAARVTDAVSAASMRTIASLAPRSVVCITGSGATARAICRYRPDAAVFAVTTDERTFRQLNLVWGQHRSWGQPPVKSRCESVQCSETSSRTGTYVRARSCRSSPVPHTTRWPRTSCASRLSTPADMRLGV